MRRATCASKPWKAETRSGPTAGEGLCRRHLRLGPARADQGADGATLISATVPYRDATRAFKLAADHTQAMKVLLSFD
jgi:hypothetical protein